MADLKPFEKRMYWLTVIGIAVAFVTGVFIYSQFRAIADQNQILSSQAISAAAGAMIGELNTRKQLAFVQQQTTAAQIAAESVRDSAAISKLSMIASNRAYVQHNGFRWVSHPTPDNERVFWRIHPQWINTGNTPTRNLRIYIGYELRDSAQEDCQFSPSQTVVPTATLASKGIAEGALYDIWDDDLAAISDGKKYFYVWGVVKYNDTFPGTPAHITKFCSNVVGVTGNSRRPYDEKTNRVDIFFSSYGKQNCSDDECGPKKAN